MKKSAQKQTVWKRLSGYLKAYRLRLFLVLLFASASTVLSGALRHRQGHHDLVRQCP